MKYRQEILTVAIAVHFLAVPQLQAQESSPSSHGMRITSCLVYSAKSPDRTYDCSAEAARICNDKQLCEIQIGDNLTAGKDIEPGAGFLGRLVKFTYACGELLRQRGPYHQNDHASMILECNGPE